MLDQTNINDVEKKLDRACDHVTEFWFPVNSGVLRRIRAGMANGSYRSDIQPLLAEIRSDFSLYTYCVKELLAMMQEEGETPTGETTPAQLLELAGIEKLNKILGEGARSISKHQLVLSNDVQAARFQEALTSASAAEVLAEQMGIDADLGYSSAILRQLGYLLIAWNYPKVYEKAMLSAQTGQDLDRALEDALEFAPRQLTARLIRRWGMAEEFSSILLELNREELEIRTAIAARESDSESLQSALGDNLLAVGKACEVGEALARANLPSQYPKSAEADWSYAKAEVERALGEDGLMLINDRLTQYSQRYAEMAPSVFPKDVVLDPDANFARYRTSYINRKNPFIQSCSEGLRERLERFYVLTEFDYDVKAKLRILILDLLPSTAFTGGCIFTMDTLTSKLTPMTKIGKPLSPEVKPVAYQPYNPDADIINAAFKAKEPAVVEQILTDGTVITSFSGAIGQSDWIGVLYLEMPKEVYEARKESCLGDFRALCQALADSLATS